METKIGSTAYLSTKKCTGSRQTTGTGKVNNYVPYDFLRFQFWSFCSGSWSKSGTGSIFFKKICSKSYLIYVRSSIVSQKVVIAFLDFLTFLTFIFYFMLDPDPTSDPEPDPESKCIPVPVPLREKSCGYYSSTLLRT